MNKEEILTKDVTDLLNQVIIRFRLNDVNIPKEMPQTQYKLNNVRLIVESLLKDLSNDDKDRIRDRAEDCGNYYSSTC